MMHTRLLAFIFSLLIAFAAQAQKDKKTAESTVTRDGVEAKVRFLASDELRGRDTPSPGLDIAARYIATQLIAYGVKTVPGMENYYQQVRMISSSPPSKGSFAVGDSTFDFKDDMIMTAGGSGVFSGDIVFVEYGTEEDFAAADVKGKIVVARSGTKGQSDARSAFRTAGIKATMAEEKGAVALIELYNSPQPAWKLLQFYLGSTKVGLDEGDEESESTFPRIWLEDLANEKLSYFTNYAGKAQLEIIGADESRFNTQNVIGLVAGTDPDLKNEYIVYSGHYDHVGVGESNSEGDSIFNGTRDNAIGSMTILEAAQNIAANPLKRSALFIFFTGEEKGLLGSEWYVGHPVVPLDQVVYCFNSDNAGYNNTDIITIVGLNRTNVSDKLITAGKAFGLEVIDDPVPDQNLYDRSDHVNFARAGIPALMFTLGLTAFDEELMKFYHQQADNPDSVDYDYLYKFTQSYVYACRLIGNMKERPTWTEGDKYYDAGVELYGR